MKVYSNVFIHEETGDLLGYELAIKRNADSGVDVCRGNAEFPLAASLNAVFLHEPLHPLFAHANVLRPQLPPDRGPRQVICACWGGDARPTVGTPILRIDSARAILI